MTTETEPQARAPEFCTSWGLFLVTLSPPALHVRAAQRVCLHPLHQPGRRGPEVTDLTAGPRRPPAAPQRQQPSAQQGISACGLVPKNSAIGKVLLAYLHQLVFWQPPGGPL